MNFEEQNFNTKPVKLEKESFFDPSFLQEQIRLPKNEWDEKFKKFIEEKIKENQGEKVEESEGTPEILQERTFKRYVDGLGLDESNLKNKKVLDLGAGEGEFIKYLIKKQITSEAFGIDINLKEKNIGEEFKDNFFEGSFEEDLPIKNVDYVISLGAVSNGVWAGEEVMNIQKIIEKSLSSLKENGEIRIYPIQESAKDNPLEGIDKSKQKWEELLEKISKTLEVDYKIQPRNVRITGYDNEIILDSVLIMRKRNK